MDYIVILGMMAKAASGILANMKTEKARKEGESYLKRKYNLTTSEVNVGYSMRLMETAYSDEWEKTLMALVSKVLSARKLSLPLSEVCADIYIMTAVLKHGPRRVDARGDVLSAGHSYSYLKSLANSKTHESLEDLARGRGSAITLQVVQRELRRWCAKEALNLERRGSP